MGRPSNTHPFRSFVVGLLLHDPRLQSLEIYERARELGYRGGKSALYALIATLRPRRRRSLSQTDKVPGEISRHGFGQANVRIGAETHLLTFFASRLEYSGWMTVSIVSDEGVESLVRALVQHFHAMGGVPLLATFDRTKPIATYRDKPSQIVDWDPAFTYSAVELGIGVEIRARRGPDRGPGANLGNWVKYLFLRSRTFRNHADLEQQLRRWLAEVNSRAPSELSGETPAKLLVQEQQRLRELKLDPRQVSMRFPAIVGPRATVLYGRHSFPMPAESIGLVGALHVYPDRVTIVAGAHEATFPRDPPFKEPVLLCDSRDR